MCLLAQEEYDLLHNAMTPRYAGPVVAITGSQDQVVRPGTSDVLVHSVASIGTTRYSIDGADHEYQATSDDQTYADEVIRNTNRWLTSRLGTAASTSGDPG